MADRTLEQIESLADEIVKEHSARDNLFDDLEDYYFQEGDKDPRREHEQEGIERVCLPHGSSAVELVQDLLSDTELTITVPAKKDTDPERVLADEAEVYCEALLADSARVQQQDILERAAWLAPMRGGLAGRVLPLPSFIEASQKGQVGARAWFDGRARLPLTIQLRDPRYVYPAFGTDRLDYVVECWKRSVADIRQSYGRDVLSGKPEDEEVEWREYWDDEWFVYWADGELIDVMGESGRMPHTYGEIPWVYTFARQTAKQEPEKRARPLLGSVRHVIDLMDDLDGMDLTFIKQYIGTAWAISYSGETKPKVSLGVGDKVFLKEGETITPIQGGRRGLELDEFRGKVKVMLERGTFPGTVYGEDPGRLIAGYAISLLNQSGQVKLRPIIKCVEQFMGAMLEKALMVSEKYIAIQTGEAIPFWTLEEKEEKGGATRTYRSSRKLDAKALDGVYSVDVRLGEVLPVDEVTNYQLAAQSQTPGAYGRPLLSWQTAMEKFGIVSNVTQERQRIEREAAWTDPEVRLLSRAIATIETKKALMRKLKELGVEPEEILMQARMEAQGMAPEAQQPLPGPGGMPGAMPPEGMPPGPGMEEVGAAQPPPSPYEVMGDGMPWAVPPGPGEELLE